MMQSNMAIHNNLSKYHWQFALTYLLYCKHGTTAVTLITLVPRNGGSLGAWSRTAQVPGWMAKYVRCSQQLFCYVHQTLVCPDVLERLQTSPHSCSSNAWCTAVFIITFIIITALHIMQMWSSD